MLQVVSIAIVSLISFVNWYPAEIVDFSMSECMIDTTGNTEFDYNTRLLNKSYLNGVTHLQIQGEANCAGVHNEWATFTRDTLFLTHKQGVIREMLPVFDTLADGTVSRYTEADIRLAKCDCCYTFNYKIKGPPNKYYPIVFDEELVLQPK